MAQCKIEPPSRSSCSPPQPPPPPPTIPASYSSGPAATPEDSFDCGRLSLGPSHFAATIPNLLSPPLTPADATPVPGGDSMPSRASINDKSHDSRATLSFFGTSSEAEQQTLGLVDTQGGSKALYSDPLCVPPRSVNPSNATQASLVLEPPSSYGAACVSNTRDAAGVAAENPAPLPFAFNNFKVEPVGLYHHLNNSSITKSSRSSINTDSSFISGIAKGDHNSLMQLSLQSSHLSDNSLKQPSLQSAHSSDNSLMQLSLQRAHLSGYAGSPPLLPWSFLPRHEPPVAEQRSLEDCNLPAVSSVQASSDVCKKRGRWNDSSLRHKPTSTLPQALAPAMQNQGDLSQSLGVVSAEDCLVSGWVKAPFRQAADKFPSVAFDLNEEGEAASGCNGPKVQTCGSSSGNLLATNIAELNEPLTLMRFNDVLPRGKSRVAFDGSPDCLVPGTGDSRGSASPQLPDLNLEASGPAPLQLHELDGGVPGLSVPQGEAHLGLLCAGPGHFVGDNEMGHAKGIMLVNGASRDKILLLHLPTRENSFMASKRRVHNSPEDAQKSSQMTGQELLLLSSKDFPTTILSGSHQAEVQRGTVSTSPSGSEGPDASMQFKEPKSMLELPRLQPSGSQVADGKCPLREVPSYKGIRYRQGKWVAEIKCPGKNSRYWLGTFATVAEATEVYERAALKLYGQKDPPNCRKRRRGFVLS